jgi:hypothetical protein
MIWARPQEVVLIADMQLLEGKTPSRPEFLSGSAFLI